MKNGCIILLLAFSLAACKKDYRVIMPDTTGWDLFNAPDALPLNPAARTPMEGVYGLINGNATFGDLVAVKWSYIIQNNDSIFHVSGFFGKDIAYFICEGKKLNGTILLNGYWRKMVSTETGIMRLTISPENGANILLSANPVISTGNITIDGLFSNGQEDPKNAITFIYSRKLHQDATPFNILAHRSGGRTSDLLPVSENSVEMILKTPEFGSTGIEIDVRLTSDGIPILYHDDNLNLRETQKNGLLGPVENYTYEQLSVFVRLIHGEKIPKLRQALDAVVYQTGLSFVWLDTKYIGSMDSVRFIQREYLQKAAAIGRTLQIVIGLPGTDQYNQFQTIPNFTTVPSLCELELAQAQAINAKIWAPRFTLGTQNDQVALAHQSGMLAFVWTLDVPEFISSFIKDGHFDGVLSNFPSCVAYNYYVQE